MVGRTAEQALLNEQLAALRNGCGNVVVVGGEAGIGKSTIARYLVNQARAHDYLALMGHCYDLMAASPYGLWLDLASDYAQIDSADLPALPEILTHEHLDHIHSQAALHSEVAAFLHAVSRARPTVIVLEDVQWADPASLELLRHIASRIRRVPLLIAVTYRVDELTRRHPFYNQLPSIIHESDGLRIDLRRLGSHELDDLVARRYGTMRLDDRAHLVSYLDQHAEGNPFFVIELLRALEEREDGGLDRRSEEWTVTGLDRIVVPPLVRHVIDARVAQLGEDTRTPLGIAAVIGHEVSIDLLAAVSDLPETELYEIIDRAVEWHLFSATAEGTGLQFVHALTRESLYESIPPHRRRLLHRAVAETLERLPLLDTDAIAYHYQQAGDARAPDWLIRAGERAQRAYAWLTARDRFATAAHLLDGVPGQEGARARLLYRCGRLQRYSDAEAGIVSLRTAARLAQVAGDAVLAADAVYSLGLAQCFDDQWTDGVPNMIEGLRMLEAIPPGEARIRWAEATWLADALPAIELAESSNLGDAVHSLAQSGISYRRGSLPWFLATVGRLDEAKDMVRRYRQHIDTIEVGPLVLSNAGHAAFGLGIAHTSQGCPDGAREEFATAREIYLRLDHHACIAFVHLTELIDRLVAYDTLDVAGRERTSLAAEEALEKASGAFQQGMSCRLARLVNLWLAGQWSEARRIASQDTIYATYVVRRQVTHALAPIAYHQGRLDEVSDIIATCLPHGPETEPGSAVLLDGLMLQRLGSSVALERGDLDAARRWLEANDRWLAWSGAAQGRAANDLAWATLYRAEGNVETAQDRANRALAEATAPDQPLVLIGTHRLLGELAAESGSIALSERHLTTAIDLSTACRTPFERARSLLSLARVRANSDPESAEALAIDARDICEPLDAAPTLAGIDVLLRELDTATLSQRLPAGLTAREVEVLRLVASGLTDAEIADRLSISPRTVGQHLRSTYNKLDVRSRTEATRFAIEHGLT
ncbi:MAG TPA: AAA family ATPase [Thermomicrobiales bacterium]|nr:AAA family ATPase [Thermomicrobiales bacterium]